jgi:hypothetical protein
MRTSHRVVAWTCLAMGTAAWGRAQELPPTARRLCDPADPAQNCPGPTCRCTEDTFAVVFPATGNSILGGAGFPAGTRLEAEVILDTAAGPVLTWSFGVMHDTRYMHLDAVTLEGTDARDIARPGFVLVLEDAEECVDFPECSVTRKDAGFICAVLTDDPLVRDAVPPRGGSLCRAFYSVVADPGVEGTRIQVTDRLRVTNSPPADLGLVLRVDGVFRTPQWVADGLIRRGPGGPTFHRGDVDGDGEGSLADVIALLEYLFQKGSSPSCLETADVDDSGGINVTDGIQLLQWLFLGGPPPGPPGPPPGPCGEDPVDSPSSLGCRQSQAC